MRHRVRSFRPLQVTVFMAALATPLGASAQTFSYLEPECEISGVHMMMAFNGVAGTLAQAGKVVVEGHDPFELAFLSLPGCKLTPVLTSRPRPTIVMSVAASGALLFDGGLRANTRYFKHAGGEIVPVPAPADARNDWDPVLSDDGSAVVWVTTRRLDRGAFEQHLTIRDMASGSERTVALPPHRKTYRLIGADVRQKRYAVVNYPHTVTVVEDNGNPVFGPIDATAVRGMVSPQFRYRGTDWFAWDHGGSDSSSIQWSAAAGSGSRNFAPASLKSVDVNPRGTLVAYSTAGNRALRTDGSVGILRVTDGSDLFSRIGEAQVAFLGERHLALGTRQGVQVLRLPGPSDRPGSAAAIATAPVDIEDRMIEMGGKRAQALGLTWERPTSATAAAILGSWKLVDVEQPGGCGGDQPFLEFRSDGIAYDLGPRKQKYPYKIGARAILVGTPGSDGYVVYQMSGGFYIPSFECVLVKLEKMN
ncbi:MAG TPA: hypothetical protein VEB19_00115 [Gemmatimonadaceae bacterium]|nr:hypothetical protein [Gemmatimonadaceae bacterium]